MKRVFLFLATNFAVLIVITLIFHIFGLNRSINLGGVLAGAAVMGFTGSIISLLMSKYMAKQSVGAVVIEQPQNEVEQWLLDTVAAQARQWGLQMPEVAIYDSPEVNAFATGATKNSSLVAVSTGLLRGMTRDEVEAVLAHEMAHIGNGDMVTLTLIQGVVNTFVIFFAKLIAGIIANTMGGNNNNGENQGNAGVYFAVNMILQMLFGFLASLIVYYFSRQREYRADAGAAKLVGAPKMIAALQRLKGQGSALPADMAAMGIASENKDSLMSTHPSLDNRIARLQYM
ncbi:protease HtpX [Alysiella crassa]|uniref:Protease HtpX homolog n=1 Tax=Alysiella crassa TaxID=153491 RepID=A0A376BK49_9NEIS|nr:protease HtpX [Alysiella crassa]UOP07749.1 protease HtpX [Alysiella crassa]SSY70008.1 Protease HtpX [Alysiella crassa]